MSDEYVPERLPDDAFDYTRGPPPGRARELMHPSRRKGTEAEREAAKILADELGLPGLSRRYNIGTHDDIGDLIGLPSTVVQVCSLATNVVNVGIVRKPLEAEQQRINDGATFAFTMLRIRGGTWRVVMTIPQALTMWREATA